jgi:pimeloyl-ACP methyl ester carboxylesterase
MDFQKIGLVMDLPFSKFGAVERSLFLKDFAELTGCAEDEMKEVIFWQGCVKFEAKIDAEAANFLLEMYEKAKISDPKDKIPEPVEKLIDFLKKYKISYVSTGLAAKIVVSQDVENDDDKNAVFFIHGWRGDENSFGNMPGYIENQLGIVAKVYQYPTSITGKPPSLYFISQNLDNWIRNNLISEKRKIALIGHSMGGLIIRKTISSQLNRDEPIDKRVQQITFIASPHTGVWVAKAAKAVPGGAQFQASEMDPDSPVLAEIVSGWNTWVKKRAGLVKSIRSIYGTEDGVVGAAIAMGDDAESVPIMGANHVNIVKPQSKTDEIVKTVARFLLEAELATKPA